MGVKTPLSLQEAQAIFPEYAIVTLEATTNGIMDTTYIAISGTKQSYILKKYERDLGAKIQADAALLSYLHTQGLNTPLLLAAAPPWYLYTKLSGSSPKHATLSHINALGRFVAHLHNATRTYSTPYDFFDHYPIKTILRGFKKSHFYHYKKFAPLLKHRQTNDGFIHGDLFCDNILFHNNTIAVFDFIDGGNGNFAFDLGVALFACNPHNKKSYTTLLLKAYNQQAKKKIHVKELLQQRQRAQQFYELLRFKRKTVV